MPCVNVAGSTSLERAGRGSAEAQAFMMATMCEQFTLCRPEQFFVGYPIHDNRKATAMKNTQVRLDAGMRDGLQAVPTHSE